jgi:hypothetical protein
LKRTIILSLVGILWFCKPIPFENVVRNQPVSQEVLDFRGGGRDSTESSSSARKIPQVLLKKFFPDWTERVNYQNQQVKFFQSGKKNFKKQPELVCQIESS